MIREFGSHSWCERLSATSRVVVDFNSQRFEWPDEVIDEFFPGSRGAIQFNLLRESQGFALQPTVEKAHGQMGPFDRSAERGPGPDPGA